MEGENEELTEAIQMVADALNAIHAELTAMKNEIREFTRRSVFKADTTPPKPSAYGFEQEPDF